MSLGAASKPGRLLAADGRVHVVPSTKETVRLGVYDTNLPAHSYDRLG